MIPNVKIDASTPAASGLSGLVSSITSNAFTPPAQSLVLLAVGAGKSTSAPTFSCSDSSGATWNTVTPATGATSGGVALFWAYFPVSPGSITVTVTTTGSTTGLFIVPIVLIGAHWDQSTSGVARLSATSGTTGSVTVTTTRLLSFIYGISNNATTSGTWTPVANTSADVNDPAGVTDNVVIVSWKLAGLISVPKPFLVGGTWGASSATNQIAMEIGAAPIQGFSSTSRHPGKGPDRRARFFKSARDTTPPVASDVAIDGDTPGGRRCDGPDGSVAIDVPLVGDAPSAQRASGPVGSGVDVAPAADAPAAHRASAPDGNVAVGYILADTAAAQRSSGPTGAVALGVTVTDGPTGLRYGVPDGGVQLGVPVGPDSPSGLHYGTPDGLVRVDLAVTSPPSGYRSTGPDGAVALGVTVAGDTPAAHRLTGPVGAVTVDANPSVTVTDTPSGRRLSGPDGVPAISIVLVGDSPTAHRGSGPDGLLAVGVTVTDGPSAPRYAGPVGALVIIVGATDTPSGYRSMGPDGSMGIAVPITADTPDSGRYGGPVGVLVIGVGADVIAGSAPPTGTRLAGPDGMVLLAVLPQRQPYVSPLPLLIPDYSLWVADTRTGRMLWELPAESHSWTSLLNDAGTIRATLAIESTWDALADQDERDPRVLLREVLSGPWRFSLVLRWGTNVVWAGPYITFARNTPASVDLNGAEIAKILSKRIMVAPSAPAATDPTADLTLGPYSTKPHAAVAMLTQMASGPNNDLPLVITDPGGSGQDARVYYGYDLADYWSKLQALTAEVDGPEVRFDPQIITGSDGDYLSWVVQIGAPHVGRDTTTWMFDSDETAIVGATGDGSNMAFGVYAAGSGSARDKLVSHAFNGQLLTIGWPMLETVDTTHSSETVYPILSSYANADLTAYSTPIMSFQTQVPADADPMVGTYRVGEHFSVDVRNDPILPDGSYTRRIAGIAGTEKPWVTLTDANPLPVGAT